MAREDEADGSREGLLHAISRANSRHSLEQLSAEDGGADELELLDFAYEDEPSPSGRQKPRPAYTYEEGAGALAPKRFGKLRRVCWERRSCITVSLILLGGLIGVILGSGVWVWKTAPLDGQSPPWYPTPQGGTLDSWKESYEKAAAMVNRMTLVEKVNITTGTGWSQGLCVGNTGPANSVGFPPLCLQDGPLGIRFADHSTAWPAGITVGSTWNRELMYKRGRAHGQEVRLKGINVLLGPSMGPIGRMPAAGRNWEGFGSDPVLQAVGAANTIRGIQDEGVIATAKHFIGNEQEHFRQSFEWGLPNAMSSNIDDRTLHELYLWPFAEAVRAGVGSVMCSYNMVNNSYACGNSKLMNGILKDELGFQGFVQSDWLAQRSGVASALAGLDMSMPGDGLYWAQGDPLWGHKLTQAVLNGSVPIERLNDMATRIVAAWYQLGQDNKTVWPSPPPEGDGGPNFSSWTNDEVGLIHQGSGENESAVVNKFIDVQGTGEDFHGRLAQTIAAEGIVLLKNENNILPLSRTGPSNAKLKVGIFGEDAGPGEGPNACADRGCNQGTLASGWGSGAVEFPYLVDPVQALESAFDSKSVVLTKLLYNNVRNPESIRQIEQQELCLAFINADGGEGFISWSNVRADRNDLHAQKGGDDLVENVANLCGKGKGSTIVIIHSIGPIVMERWINLPGVKAVVLANLPGEESGNALVDVLFGDLDASGRLPYTIGKTLEDYGEGGQVLYYPNGVVPQQDFKEGLYIDYRHFDKSGITPRYEFGFGLSYTTFDFSDLTLTKIKQKSPVVYRPSGLTPPRLSNVVPDPSTALFPKAFRKVHKYIYPYISSEDNIESGRYPYPKGYDVQQPLSEAGGGPGGNPLLWDVHLNVSVTVTNTGKRKGKEVVQLYLSFPTHIEDISEDQIEFPPKVLRNFEKVELDIEESQVVTFSLTRKDLSYWSVTQQNWVMPTSGQFEVLVGRSSRDLPLRGKW
jgi:beta-glucosidase-like glycosyl hydrolase